MTIKLTDTSPCDMEIDELETLLDAISKEPVTGLYGFDAAALVASAMVELGITEDAANTSPWLS